MSNNPLNALNGIYIFCCCVFSSECPNPPYLEGTLRSCAKEEQLTFVISGTHIYRGAVFSLFHSYNCLVGVEYHNMTTLGYTIFFIIVLQHTAGGRKLSAKQKNETLIQKPYILKQQGVAY